MSKWTSLLYKVSRYSTHSLLTKWIESFIIQRFQTSPRIGLCWRVGHISRFEHHRGTWLTTRCLEAVLSWHPWLRSKKVSQSSVSQSEPVSQWCQWGLSCELLVVLTKSYTLKLQCMVFKYYSEVAMYGGDHIYHNTWYNSSTSVYIHSFARMLTAS
jgi:hypothetical protein